MPVLTLFPGDATAVYYEHPIETARRALKQAVQLELKDGNIQWASLCERIVSSLPERGAIVPTQETTERQAWKDGYREAKDAWSRTSTERREALLLEVLGDERLLIREVAARMNGVLGYSEQCQAVGVYEATPLVKRMLRDGHLKREAETFNKTHMRYRYSRGSTALSDPACDESIQRGA